MEIPSELLKAIQLSGFLKNFKPFIFPTMIIYERHKLSLGEGMHVNSVTAVCFTSLLNLIVF